MFKRLSQLFGKKSAPVQAKAAPAQPKSTSAQNPPDEEKKLRDKISEKEALLAKLEAEVDPDRGFNPVVGNVTIGVGATAGVFLGGGALAAAEFFTGGYLLAGSVIAGVGAATVFVGLGLGLGGASVYFVGNYLRTQWQKQKINDINELRKEIFQLKITLIKMATNNVDLVFNGLSSVKTAEKIGIKSIKLDGQLLQTLCDTVASKKRKKLNFKINRIEFKSVSLSDSALGGLLITGLGDFDTEELSLTNDNHDAKTIKKLLEYVTEKNVFQNLKKFNIANNNLDSECLDDLADIIKKIRLKNLDVSHNPKLFAGIYSNRNASKQASFFSKHDKISSLEQINLSDTGINFTVESLADFITKAAPALRRVDLRENSHLPLEIIIKYLEDAVEKNISIEEMLTDRNKSDGNSAFTANRVIKERKGIFSQHIRNPKKENIPNELHLLNYRLENPNAENLPNELTDCLAKTRLSITNMDTIIQQIKVARRDCLGVSIDSNIAISERELVAYYAKDLQNLYAIIVQDKQAKDKSIYYKLVDKSLIEAINVPNSNVPKETVQEPFPEEIASRTRSGAIFDNKTSRASPKVQRRMKSTVVADDLTADSTFNSELDSSFTPYRRKYYRG